MTDASISLADHTFTTSRYESISLACSLPDLTPSQERAVAHIADAVALGQRVSIRGAAGSGRSTVLRAAAGRVAAELGRATAVLDAQTVNRLAWGVIKRTNGRLRRAYELVAEGVTLFLDDADCLVRVREEDTVVLVGDYIADRVVTLEPWDEEDLQAVVPEMADQFLAASADRRTPRFVALADACRNLGISTGFALVAARPEQLIVLLLERLEATCPLAIDLLFSAGEFGTLAVETDWFVGWNGLDDEACRVAVRQLQDIGLIDIHSAGAWTSPALVRRSVRQQMTPALRKAACISLAMRLLGLVDNEAADETSVAEPAGDRLLSVLPHLTTLWKRLETSQTPLAAEVLERIEPVWTDYGFSVRESVGQDGSKPTVSADVAVGRLIAEARQLRQRGALLHAEQLLAKAVRQAERSLPLDSDVRFTARVEYAEIGLSGDRHEEAVRELRDLSTLDRVRTDERQRYRIENDLASALFYQGRYSEAAAAFSALAETTSRGSASGRALNNAGECLRTLGRQEEAETLLRRAIEVFAGEGLERDPTALSARLNLGGVLSDIGHDLDAIEHFECVAKCREEHFGSDAVPTLVAKLSWVVSLCHLGRVDDAQSVLSGYLPGTGDESLEQAFRLVGATVDVLAGRRAKAELRLLRLAEHEMTRPVLASEHHRQLAGIYLQDGRIEEARRWARLGSNAVESVLRGAPAQVARVETLTALCEAASGRWEEAGQLAIKVLPIASRCGVSVAASQAELPMISALAATPGEADWASLERTLNEWSRRAPQAVLLDAITARLAEHAVESERHRDAARLIDALFDAVPGAGREAYTVRASLAILNNEPQACELWGRVLEKTPNSDTDGRDRVTKLIEELNRGDVDDGSLVGRETLSERSLIETLRESRLPAEPADEVSSADAEEVSAEDSGHALDDLFD